MESRQQKEILYLSGSILGPVVVAVLIAVSSPTHNCCSFFPELLMIIIPGAYCFYALRGILNIRLRTVLLTFAIITAIAVLTIAKTVPHEKTEEDKDDEPKTELKNNATGQPDFKSLSSAFKKGFK